MSKVIIGFDASEQSDDALVLGQALAKVYGAELHIAIVLPRTRIPFEEAIAGGQLSAQLEERLYESAERRLGNTEFVRASLDGEVGGRSAARALYEYAEDQDADLIVVGSSHRGKLGRIFPEASGRAFCAGAPCAVAVAPRGFARREHAGFNRIGIAYDGSQEADLALAEAGRLSLSVGARLLVITVVPTQMPFQMQAAIAGELLEDLRDEFVECWREGSRSWVIRRRQSRFFGRATRRAFSPSRESTSTCSSWDHAATGRFAARCSEQSRPPS